jgi:hypothetical protein
MLGLETALILSKTAAISVNLGAVEKALLAETKNMLN